MLASFGLLITLLVVILEIINWMPSIIEKEGLRKYRSMEFVRKKLHIEKIYMPAYLPEHINLRWPPAEIYAQKKPFAMIISHFHYRDSKDIGLIVHQVDANANYRPEPKIKFSEIKKESKVMIKDRPAVLITAICEGDKPCNQVSWREGDFLLTVLGKDSPRDLIRIAMSMIPD
jgi:hypothetical protein